jgi:hypothetical protein
MEIETAIAVACTAGALVCFWNIRRLDKKQMEEGRRVAKQVERVLNDTLNADRDGRITNSVNSALLGHDEALPEGWTSIQINFSLRSWLPVAEVMDKCRRAELGHTLHAQSKKKLFCGWTVTPDTNYSVEGLFLYSQQVLVRVQDSLSPAKSFPTVEPAKSEDLFPNAQLYVGSRSNPPRLFRPKITSVTIKGTRC